MHSEDLGGNVSIETSRGRVAPSGGPSVQIEKVEQHQCVDNMEESLNVLLAYVEAKIFRRSEKVKKNHETPKEKGAEPTIVMSRLVVQVEKVDIPRLNVDLEKVEVPRSDFEVEKLEKVEIEKVELPMPAARVMEVDIPKPTADLEKFEVPRPASEVEKVEKVELPMTVAQADEKNASETS
ncbi:hypothetical protein K7X08_000397 [Anisodus acutangulus]|uniref:Uncharacterized protein n=1 Tax=Anisodus acutangulus TaxID=402998 RepID=A0A9Q1M3F2_9SOLA|nr:hypothetical protein K7X08_000397 [Anisodus acutangulus]